MGQKANPISLRLNINRDFESCWYQDFNYSNLLLKELTVRKYLSSLTSLIGVHQGRMTFQFFPKKLVIYSFITNKTDGYPKKFKSSGGSKSPKGPSTPFASRAVATEGSQTRQTVTKGPKGPSVTKQKDLQALPNKGWRGGAESSRNGVSLRYGPSGSSSPFARPGSFGADSTGSGLFGPSGILLFMKYALNTRSMYLGLKTPSETQYSYPETAHALKPYDETIPVSDATRPSNKPVVPGALPYGTQLFLSLITYGLGVERGFHPSAALRTHVPEGFTPLRPINPTKFRLKAKPVRPLLDSFQTNIVLRIQTPSSEDDLKIPNKCTFSEFTGLSNTTKGAEGFPKKMQMFKNDAHLKSKGTQGGSKGLHPLSTPVTELKAPTPKGAFSSRYLARNEAGFLSHLQVEFYPLKLHSKYQSAVFLAEFIAQSFEKNISFRQTYRQIQKEIQEFMGNGNIVGIKIQCSGRINGAEIAKVESRKMGQTSLHTFSAQVDFAKAEAYTMYGIIGVKVWISCLQKST